MNQPYVPAAPGSGADNRNPLAWQFHCRVTGPGKTGTLGQCPVDDTQTDPGNKTTGSRTFRFAPSNKPYTVRIRAYRMDITGQEVADSNNADYTFRVYSVFSIKHISPYTGPSFNNPISSVARGRKSLTRVIRTINSMPGYRQGLQHAPCPGLHDKGMPGAIRITLYSMTDGSFTNAMINASHRCLSVQILMNNHLNSSNDPAWRRLQHALGPDVKDSHGNVRRSFAHRCHFACRGGGVLHTKMYLFDSRLPAPNNKIRNTVYTGSSNMTSNASQIQWNDLYGVNNDPGLYQIFAKYFDKMKQDNGYHRNQNFFYSGKYAVTFWPVRKGADPEMKALKDVTCSGADGGTGIHGHTVVYINMHAWFGLRGLAFQRQVRSLYSKGCYIRILYSFMTKRVYYRLTHGTNGRMQARRTIFSLDGNRYADVYSHYKNILVSGHWQSDRSAKVVFTGSNNFTPDGTNFDEDMLRIRDSKAFNQYRSQFDYIKRRKSSARYASFLEPVGGGRAPNKHDGFVAGPTDTPTILSPDVVRKRDGTPRALD